MGIELAITSFLFGLASSFHCIAMCGPLVAVVNFNKENKVKQNLLYNLGRLISYSCMGALFGFIGLGTSTTGNLIKIQNLSTIIASIIIILIGFGMFFGNNHFITNRITKYFQINISQIIEKFKLRNSLGFSLGFISALLPCGMLYPAFTISFATGNPIAGSISMVAFFFGTFPGLFIFGLGLNKFRPYLFTKTARVIGYLVILSSFFLIQFRNFNTKESNGKAPSCHQEKETIIMK